MKRTNKNQNQHSLKLNTAPVSLVIEPFDVRSRLAEGHACGGWDEKFKASVTLISTDLDEHGFVVENLSVIRAIRKFFKGRTYVASCEQLCQCIAHICHDLVGDRLISCHVKVFNLTGHLALDWERGQSIPPLPLCVSK
jgi:hypothetical protein